MGTGSISPEVSCLTCPTCTGMGCVVCVAITCSDVGAVAVGKERAGVDDPSDFIIFVGVARRANRAKVTLHANRNASSAQSKIARVIVSVVYASMGECSFKLHANITDNWDISLD